MADSEDRTQPASERRLQRAREDGNVAMSREVPLLAVLASAALVIVMSGPGMARTLARDLAVLLEQMHTLDPMQAIRMATQDVLHASTPFVFAALAAGSLAVLLQTGFLVSTSSLGFDATRMDPRRGLSRLLGPQALLETAKSLLKIGVVAGACWHALSGGMKLLPAAFGWGADTLLEQTTRLVMQILLAMLAAQAVIAVLDVVRARLRHAAGLRMSRQELREESRESEGDPAIKARIRRIRMARARKRMMAAVPKATVVITNPTHYAVALVYDQANGGAPRIVAKGVDGIAARIREVAQANRVPIVANPPLARALYPLDLDREVPAEHFQAVAEIIAYVWRLRGQARQGGRR
jgi:flagellar biosynthetic protein FlhB